MGESDTVGNENKQLSQHINRFIRPCNKRAFLALGVTVLIEALAVLLIRSGVYFLGWSIHAMNIIRIFVQFHDMAHYSFFESIPLNKAVGHVLGIYVQFPFQMWRDGHNYHHKHFGNLDRYDFSQTIFFTKEQYESFSTPKKVLTRLFREPPLFFLVSVQLLWLIGVPYNSVRKYGFFCSAILDKFLALLLFYVFWVIGLPILELYISLHFAQAFGTSLFHLQHSVNTPYREHMQKWDFNKAALEGSTFLDVPLFLRIFTNGIEYHHIHHLNTNVASYAIQECHDELDQEKGLNWDHFRINRVSVGLAFRSMWNVMLDEEKDTLLPFSYTHL